MEFFCGVFWEVRLCRGLLVLGWVLAGLMLAAWPARGGTFPVVGPEELVRQSGEPISVHRFFHGLNPDIPYLLILENGAAGALDPVASAEVRLNDKVVAGPERFRARVERLEIPIEPIFERGELNRLVVELAGKPGSGLRFSVVGVDVEPPEITLLRPDPLRVTTTDSPDVSIAWKDAAAQVDPETASIRLDGADLGSRCRIDFTDARCETGPLADGVHALDVQIADRAGNVGRASFALEIELDREPPRVIITSPESGSLVRTPTVGVEGTVSDNEELSRVALNGRDVSLDGERFTGRVSLRQGTRTLTVDAVDAAGNRGSAEVEVTLDLVAPELSVDPVPSVVHAPRVEVSGRLRFVDDLATFTVAGQETEISDAGFFEADVPVAPGPNRLSVRVEDLAGNVRERIFEVERIVLPRVEIAEPADLSFVEKAAVKVRGTVSQAGGTGEQVSVTVNGRIAETREDPATGGLLFEAAEVPVDAERALLEAVAISASGTVGSARVHVFRDLSPPRLVVESPTAGAVVSTGRVTVTGRVRDLAPSAGGLQVEVAGRTTAVAGGHFQVEGVPLAPGENFLRVAAVDGAGHRTEVLVPTVFQPPVGPRLEIVRGDGQAGTIGTELPEALEVRLLDAAGQPVPGAPVLFRVVTGDGELRLKGDFRNLRKVVAITDAEGLAQARLRLGETAGSGSHRVEVSSPGVEVGPSLTATATPGPPALLVLDGGGLQIGTAGAPLPEPLSVVVTDFGWNRLSGVPVHFQVVRGVGTLGNGQAEQLVVTDEDGRASLSWTLDPQEGVANNLVEATLGDRQVGFVTFVASGRVAGDPSQTAVSGRVLDNTDVPVPGVTVSVEGTELATRTDERGTFRLDGVPVGTVHLRVDGTTAMRPGTWPVLDFEIVPVPGRDNSLPRPIYLLPLEIDGGLAVSETQGGTLSLPVPGLALEIAPGSVTFPDGSKTGVVSLTVVHGDKVPKTPSFGAQPRLVLTIQPAGAVFDPPARLSLPNTAGLAPGREVELVSFDHDVGRFVVFGTGVVSEDALTVSSVPGLGLLEAGWSFEATPAPTGTAHQCSPSCEFPDGSQCIPGCPTAPASGQALGPSAKLDRRGDLRSLAAAGLECPGCDEKDIGECEINPMCESGLCVGEPVMVSEIEGPCIAPVAKAVTFTAQSNAPDKVMWMAPDGLPSEGVGPEFEVRFLMEGTREVRAGCGQSEPQDKEVTVGPLCESIDPILLELESPIPATGGFGEFVGNLSLNLLAKGCVDGDRWCFRLSRYVTAFGIGLNAPLGQTDISNAEDSDVTPATCSAVIRDFEPPPPGSPRGPPRQKFWSSRITELHERAHAADFKRRVTDRVFGGLQDFLNQDSFCKECASARPDGEVRAETIRLTGEFLADFDSDPVQNEIDAHDLSNPEYLRLIEGIRQRARTAPESEGWPEECQ